MSSLVILASMAAIRHAPPVSLAVSGIFGSISLVAWICVLIPQLFANFKAQSADGLSMAFLIVWLLGDMTNLLGALFTHLAPTAIALPCYFCIADTVLIAQCAYYNQRNKGKSAHSANGEPSEESPLLRRESSGAIGVSTAEAAAKIVPGENESDDASGGKQWLQNTLSLVAVYVVGIVAWFISYKAGAWDTADPTPDTPEAVNNPLEMAGLTLGYISAVLYLCARVPQIVKNYKEKSCEGLALLFFMLSLTGNLTYGISLVAYSQEPKYLLNALPFLLGSLGTIVEDSIIFVQFRLYSHSKRRASIE
ncbi:vacuolar amino acid transporter-like protein [Emericellopsis cladophorae]|uniref:Vacuolar amino acid transporter-like protein n=1 Tax=Emericellopsis cladophorae TaxID=2686198 RepID=A0A9P9Y2N8_9HYPO|nr:vacuolar amino acid transporter-like protein [Emericellopsis cladophorae]KAI6782488.1 vacuolar amino acid transporter-like protein [Emericellopsis cladophorae]